MALSRFQKSRFGSPVYTCRRCSKQTRDTGNDEAGLDLCYRCMKVCEAENAESDHGKGSPEHTAALAAVPSNEVKPRYQGRASDEKFEGETRFE